MTNSINEQIEEALRRSMRYPSIHFMVEPEKEEYKMSESQSRYGIVDKLNSRKIEERKALAELETELSTRTKDHDRVIAETKNSMTGKKATYKDDHKAWKKMKEFELSELEREYQNDKQEIENLIKESDETYEEKFERWYKDSEEKVKQLEKSKDGLAEEINRKIQTKKDIIKEIEGSIDSLKEISRESKTQSGE